VAPKRDPNAIERRLLDLAYTTNLEITATSLAYFAPCSIDEADAVLSDLTARDRLQMDISDDGAVSYRLLGRPKVAEPAPQTPLTRALVRHAPPVASPLAAALFSAFIPGAGHVYTGRVVAAVLWFLVVSMGYVLIVPGLILHLFSMVSAAASARRLNASQPPMLLAA
jgi:TM2 domain-containing membrane protein YozV